FALYSGHWDKAVGMWLDASDSTTANAIRFGLTDASGSPVTEWMGLTQSVIAMQTPGDVFFVMTGGALWFGNLINWQLNAQNAFKSGGGLWAATSDARVKRDVVDYVQGLDAIMALRPVRYCYQDNWSREGQRLGQLSDEQNIEYF